MALMRFSWQMLLATAYSIVSSIGWLNSAKNWVVLSSYMINLGVILMRRVWRLTKILSTLSEILSNLKIDGNPVVAEFIEGDTPAIVGTRSKEWIGNRNISCKLWNVQIENVAWAFNHDTWNLFLKDFYHHLYQLFTRVTELNWQKMTKMLTTYPCIRIFPCKMPWFHTIILVHLWITI